MSKFEITEESLVGWFSDLRIGYPNFSTARDSIDSIAVDVRNQVAKYASSGHLLGAGGFPVKDVMNPNHVIKESLEILTDGEFIWRSDLAYYVSTYGVKVPDSFVSKAVSLGVAPALSETDIFQISDAFGKFRQSRIKKSE